MEIPWKFQPLYVALISGFKHSYLISFISDVQSFPSKTPRVAAEDTGLAFSSIADGFTIVNFCRFNSKLKQISEVCTCLEINLQ